jgi:membrane protein DedA with SNARE-associated domain
MGILLGTDGLANGQVMATLPILLLAGALAFVMNAVALPLPPTWVVLAAIYGTTHVPLLLLTLCGTAGAALGRGVFALSIRFFDTRLPAKLRANAEALARAVHRRARWATPFVAVYTFLPLPSNPLFAAVGMGALPLRPSMAGYFLGRWANNTIALLAARPVVGNLHDLFARSLSWRSLAQAAVAVVAYLIFLSLPWRRWLGLDAPEAA